jgi:hypothetical protein
MATPVTHAQERETYAAFARQHGEEKYRRLLAELYAAWDHFNQEFFRGELPQPHLAIGRTAPRCLGHCSRNTDYGGKIQIALNGGLVFGTNLELVVQPWLPAEGGCGEGTRAFLDDLLLRFIVQQYVLEVLGTEERGYRGFGPDFTEQANRIGALLGLKPVVARHRGTETRSPLASGWPHVLRRSDYYSGDITEHALDLACRHISSPDRTGAVLSEGLIDLLLFRLNQGKGPEVVRLLERHRERLRQCRTQRQRSELAGTDAEGKAPAGVKLERAWLKWNDGTVRRLAQGIVTARFFWEVPLLAEALRAAGCKDERILRHLEEPREHTHRCWVLRLLLAREPE